MRLAAELDVATGRLRLSDAEGRLIEDEPFPIASETEISQVRIDFDRKMLSLVLPDQSTATMAMQLEAERQQAHLASRPLVYLDQNHWSKLAAVRYGGRGVDREDADAARVLMTLAQHGRIVLPLSAGHAVETGAMYGVKRSQIACAMLELSQGWLMRHPCWIRQEELATARAGGAGPARRVFVQDADQLFTRPLREPDLHHLPDPTARLGKAVINALSLASTLLDREKLPDTEGRAAAAKWARTRQQAADAVRADGVPAERVRHVANAQVLVDAIGEFARVWPDSDADARDWWIAHSYNDISRMPCLSRTRAIFYTRMRNGTRWEPNDLHDILYLSCASGYADLVVGERRTIGELRTATQIVAGGRVASRLAEAPAALADLGFRF